VDEAAEAGDAHAVDILAEAAGHTSGLADSVVRKLRLDEEPLFKVGAWGSAIVRSRLHFACFKERLEHRYGNVQVLIADVDAAMGACRMALALMNGVPQGAGRGRQ
jgi:N-acetylglucosamine kinase-like BadF-type ATPase